MNPNAVPGLVFALGFLIGYVAIFLQPARGCRRCGDSGWVRDFWPRQGGYEERWIPCPDCAKKESN